MPMNPRSAALVLLALLAWAGVLAASDCNQNGIEDSVDVSSGSSKDCNRNGSPDECDILPRTLRYSFPAYFEGPELVGRAAAADFNGDGDLDLAIANFFEVQMVRGAKGAFRSETRFPPILPLENSTTMVGIKAGDIDGDRDPDLATMLVSPERLTLHRNRGDGSFEEPKVLAAPDEPAEFVLEDLDGDQDLDLAMVGAGSLLIHRNDGQGSFPDLPRDLPAPAGAIALAAGDLNGDKKVDLAAVNPFGLLMVYLNAGLGAFLAESVELPDLSPRRLAIADLDGDGDQDLAIADAGFPRGIAIYTNRGAAKFESDGKLEMPVGADFVVPRDLDEDGDVDLAATSSVTPWLSVFLNQGGGTFATGMNLAHFDGPFDLLLEDFDGDAKLDAAIPDSGVSSLVLLWGEGKGKFRAPAAQLAGEHASGGVLLDLNGDQLLDFAVAERKFLETDAVHVFPGRGDGTLAPLVETPIGSDGARGLAAADIDADTHQDLIVVNQESDELVVLPSDGQGGFRSPLHLPVEGKPSAAVVADLDADGALDVAVAQEESSRVLVLLEPGAGLPGPPAGKTFSAGTAPVDIAAADLDRDGDLELITANRESEDLTVLVNAGGGEFLPRDPLPFGPETGRVAAGDVDGDGLLDLIASGDFFGSVSYFRNGGAGSWERPALLAENVVLLLADDLDDDGDLDLVTSFAVFLQEGAGFRETARTPFIMLSSGARGDLDGDALPDLAAVEGNLGVLAFRASFRPASDDRDRDGVPDDCGRAFHRGDANGDGELDIADGVSVLEFLFLGARPPRCLEAMDAQDDGRLDIADGVHLLHFLFTGGPPPAPPGPPGSPCGPDPGPETLTCREYLGC